MKIAITQRVDFFETRNEYRDSIDQALIKLLIQSGFIPVLVPNSLVTLKENKKLIEWINIMRKNTFFILYFIIY